MLFRNLYKYLMSILLLSTFLTFLVDSRARLRCCVVTLPLSPMKKLSFSLQSKPSSKPKPSQNFVTVDKDDRDINSHEFVVEFDASKTLETRSKKFVIPPKENEWRPYKKMKNIDLPVRSVGDDLQFEVEAPTVAGSLDSNISFGLNLRQTAKDDDNDGGINKSRSESNGDELQPISAPTERVLLQKFRNDLERLPEHRGLEEFDDCPVEGFGAALLAGYGWYEGRGIGKNPKGDVEPVQYSKWTAKEGLGFVSDIPARDLKKDTKKEKERERSNSKEDVFVVGKDVRIVGGRDVGSKGKIVEILNDDLMILKLSRSGEEVKVRVFEIAELGSKEEDNCLRKLKDLKIRGSKDEKRTHKESSRIESSADRKNDSNRSREEGEGRGSRREEVKKTSQVSWLASHIRVRIISKELKRGRLYLKKGEIVDVVGPTTCDISMDGSRELIQGVEQVQLETALPRSGGPVLVLSGKHKGIFGNLIEKDVDKETGIVRDADTHALLNVKLEQIAEYIGDPSDIGY